MFVASRVESGDEGKAVLAPLPQFNGCVQTAVGCVTLRRANGIAFQVMVGDPVCPGDVIETAADGRIGIRFIDGTVFNLSRDARMVLNQFVCLFLEVSPEGKARRPDDAGGFSPQPPRGGGPTAPDVRIEELDFSVRTYNCLKKANIQTVADLVRTSEEELMNIRNFGRKSLLEVRDKLAQFNLTLAGAPLAEPADEEDEEEGEE